MAEDQVNFGEDQASMMSLGDAQTGGGDVAELKARMKAMEQEAQRLREQNEQLLKQAGSAAASDMSVDEDNTKAMTTTVNGAAAAAEDDKAVVDGRSVFVNNVDFSATPEELQAHFAACGSINRITILCDKFTGHSKGIAYVEFADPALVENALVLHESQFKNRTITVVPKRTNVPGMAYRARGRAYRGGYRGYRGGYTRGRGGYRGRGRPY